MADEQPDQAALPSEEEAEAQQGRGGRLLRRLGKVVGLGLLAVAGLVVLILAGLNTAPGKRFIADQVAGLEFENGLEIGIGRITGSIYGEMVLHDLVLSDPQGAFLTSPEVRVDWRPFAYLDNHIEVRSAAAQRMTLLRLPEFRETPPSDEPLLPDLDITIGALRIDRFVAEPAVTGEQRVATLAGRILIRDRRAQARVGARTLDAGGAAGGDRLILALDAVPEANRLQFDLDLVAPEGGIIAALAGLDERLVVEAGGRGDWEDWQGALNANLGGAPLARLGIEARSGTFDVSGPLEVARLLDGTAAALLADGRIDLTATPEERVVALEGSFSSDALRVNANGAVDLSASEFRELRSSIVLLRPSLLNLQGTGLRASALVEGPFAAPVVDYRVDARRAVVNDIGLVDFTATGEARFEDGRAIVPVTARAARITGLDAAAGGTLTDVRLEGTVAVQNSRILSDDLRLTSDRIDAGLIVIADLSTGRYAGAVDGRIDAYRIESVGVFDITTDLDLETDLETFALEGRVGARSRSIANETARDFLGGQLVAGADIRYGADGRLQFTNLSLRSPLVRVTGGRGSYAPDGRVTLVADAATEQYGAVGLQVAGTLADPRARITAERPGLFIGLADLEANVTGAPGGYRLEATGSTDYGPLTADVVLRTGANLAIDIASANLGGIDFTGALEQTASGPFTGRLRADGRGFAGLVRLDASGTDQQALVNLRARDVELPGPLNLAVGAAAVDARVVLSEQPTIIGTAQATQLRYGDTTLAAARARFNVRGGTGSVALLAEGRRGVPFRVAVNAELRPDLWRAAVSGRTRGIAFSTVGPARIVPGEDQYALLPTRVRIGDGRVSLAGTYGDELVIQSRFEDFDLAIANAFVPDLGLNGEANGSLDFSQPAPGIFPSADARMTIRGLTRTTAVSVSRPVDVSFIGRLLPTGGDARAIVRQRGTIVGRVQASLMPLAPGAGPWLTRLLEAPLGGGIRYNGPADTLFSLAGQADQRLSGPIGVAADLGCEVADPCLSGIVRGNSLVYENLTYGTRLRDMRLRGRFTNDRLQIDELEAQAGAGTVSAQGFISLSAAQGYPMDIRANLDNARLARSDQIDARATGELRLSKSAGETALLSGRLDLPEARYEIVSSALEEVPPLSGVRFRQRPGPERITGEEPAVSGPSLLETLPLDIAIDASEELYVSGMGLESEWRADLRVTGTQGDPRLIGPVELIRGTLGFAGRTFELVDGRVRFTGGAELNPVIDLTATEDIEGVTVRIEVTGRGQNPQIAFSSTPGLPQDEIVSRILFGASIADLSAIQAVQLAASLNALRGGGGGLDPIGEIQSATGIDRLRILGADEATGRGTALAAGQYLSDDIYVELVTDIRGFTATQIEVSLTPALSILSQAGGADGTDVSVRYRINY